MDVCKSNRTCWNSLLAESRRVDCGRSCQCQWVKIVKELGVQVSAKRSRGKLTVSQLKQDRPSTICSI